jgi:hypothetical protein
MMRAGEAMQRSSWVERTDASEEAIDEAMTLAKICYITCVRLLARMLGILN